jgi:3D (Asp-Asp-Asp) domain-containing protein
VKLLRVVLLAVIVGCTLTAPKKKQMPPAPDIKSDDIEDIKNTAGQPSADEILKKVKVWSTSYFTPKLNEYKWGVPMLDKNQKKLGPKLSKKDFCTCALEGSCIVGDSTYNYSGTISKMQVDCTPWMKTYAVGGKVVFSKTDYKYGKGSKSNPLRPYYSIAAKHHVFPYGTKVFIPQAVGTKYSFEGKDLIHNGHFIIEDTGGILKENQFDIFIGTNSTNPFKAFSKSRSDALYEVWLLK